MRRKYTSAVLNRKIFPISTACAVGGAGYFPVSLRRGKEQKRRQQIYVLFSPRVGSLTVVPSQIQLLVSLLTKTGSYTSFRIREARDGYINMLIDLLFEIASELQREARKIGRLTAPI